MHLSFPIFSKQGSASHYFTVFTEYFEIILFCAGNFTKSKLAGKFQMCFLKTAVRNRWCLSPVLWGFMHPLRGSSKRKRAGCGTHWNCQPINTINNLFAPIFILCNNV